MRTFSRGILILTIWLLQTSCTSLDEKIQGNWIVQSQEFLSLKPDRSSGTLDTPDFKLLSIIGDTLYIDRQKSLYSLKENELVFSWDGKICRFEIIGEADTFLGLISRAYNPDGITTIYLKRHKE